MLFNDFSLIHVKLRIPKLFLGRWRPSVHSHIISLWLRFLNNRVLDHYLLLFMGLNPTLGCDRPREVI